jgi:hypothetical protein
VSSYRDVPIIIVVTVNFKKLPIVYRFNRRFILTCGARRRRLRRRRKERQYNNNLRLLSSNICGHDVLL